MCSCSKVGCVEAWASDGAILRDIRAAVAEGAPTSIASAGDLCQLTIAKVTAAKAVTNKATGVYGLEVAGYNSGRNATWQFLPFFWTAGGDLEHVNDTGGVAALTLYSELAKNGSMPAPVVDYQQNDIAQQFEDQKAAMIVIGPCEFADFNGTKGLSWGVTSIPVPKAGMSPVGPLGGEVWVIPKTTPQRRRSELSSCVSSPLRPAPTAGLRRTVR